MEYKNWFIHVEWVVMLVTLIGGFYMIDNKIDRHMELQCARTDRLYEMFIDLIKEQKHS